MNYLYQKAILCSERLYKPIYFSIFKSSNSDDSFIIKSDDPTHLSINNSILSSSLLAIKLNISNNTSIYQNSLSDYENTTQVDDSKHVIINQNNKTTYLCNIPNPNKIAKIDINQNILSTWELNGRVSPTVYFALCYNSISNDSSIMKLTPPVYSSIHASSNSIGVIEQADLKDSAKFEAIGNSLANVSCLIQISLNACLKDYSDMSLNDLDEKTLKDLYYL